MSVQAIIGLNSMFPHRITTESFAGESWIRLCWAVQNFLQGFSATLLTSKQVAWGPSLVELG